MRILRENFSCNGGGSDDESDTNINGTMEYLNRYLVMDEMTLVASASLGQVYRTRLQQRPTILKYNGDEWLVMKIQRPDIPSIVSLCNP